MTRAGYFMEDQEVRYTAQDIRFTVKDDVLYAICLGWPKEIADDPILQRTVSRRNQIGPFC